MALQNFEDELDNISPVKTPATTTTAKPTTTKVTVEDDGDDVPSAKSTAAANDVDDNLDVQFGDEKLMRKGDGLNRVRPAEKGKVVRFALLPYIAPKSAKNHFIDEKGTYRCLTGKDGEQAFCCKKMGKDGAFHVVALVLKYTNADSKTGKIEKGQPLEWEIGFVDLSRANYAQVSRLPEEEQSVYDIDIVMTHADRAFGYEFNKISSRARWKMNPELTAQVEEAAQIFVRDGGKKLIGKLGKKATVQEFQTMLNKPGANADDASLDDVDNL